MTQLVYIMPAERLLVNSLAYLTGAGKCQKRRTTRISTWWMMIMLPRIISRSLIAVIFNSLGEVVP